MAANKSQLFRWRSDVRQWLDEVVQYQQQTGLSFPNAASCCKESFPSSDLVTFAGSAVHKGIAEWAIKTAIKEAATSLDVPIDDETVDFLTALAVDVILPAAA
jgi:hypothetical protein